MPRKGSTIRKTSNLSMSWHYRQLPFLERVMAQVERKDGCLEFMGHRDDLGYGRVRGTDGKLIRLHRAMWIKHHGHIPDKRVVMHKCDNRACIEISHLQLGTQIENMQDCHAKGRLQKIPFRFDVVW